VSRRLGPATVPFNSMGEAMFCNPCGERSCAVAMGGAEEMVASEIPHWPTHGTRGSVGAWRIIIQYLQAA
jgi:hypothetical protein